MGTTVVSYELSRRQRHKIKLYVSDDGFLFRAFAASATKRRKSPRARALLKADMAVMHLTAKEMWERIPKEKRKAAEKKICEDFDFCNKKRTYDLIVACTGIVFGIVNPPYALVCIVFMIKFHVFHDICDCENKNKGGLTN